MQSAILAITGAQPSHWGREANEGVSPADSAAHPRKRRIASALRPLSGGEARIKTSQCAVNFAYLMAEDAGVRY